MELLHESCSDLSILRQDITLWKFELRPVVSPSGRDPRTMDKGLAILQ